MRNDIHNSHPKYIQAFVSNFTYYADIDEYRTTHAMGWGSNIDSLLDCDGVIRWSVPRWSHKDDIVFFMCSKTSIKRINRVAKELEQELYSWNQSVINTFDYQYEINTAKERYKKYGGTIVGFGRLDEDPSLDQYNFQKQTGALIKDIHILDNPLPQSDFTQFLRISQGGVTPVWGDWYTKIKEMIIETNDDLPEFFLISESMTTNQSKINEKNWIRENLKMNFNYKREEEFRTFYIDYLLREISDNNSFFTECTCYKEKLKSPSFADYIICINGRLLPVEAKIDINIEEDIDYQVSKYCDMTKVILDPRTGECADLERLDQRHVLIIDERQIQFFDYTSRKRETLVELSAIKTKKDVQVLKKRIIEILAKND